MTVSSALREAEGRLRSAGVSDPALDAELLLRHVLGWDRATLVARASEELPPAEAVRFRAAVDERARRRPLQHIVGTQAFWRQTFLVSPDVLVPRPETEVLVEQALERLGGRTAPVIVDVGTGSGCIALSLAAERPDAEVLATDLSPAALAVAAENARRLGLQTRVAFHAGDLLEPLAGRRGRVDLVVSNPPYVDPAELAALSPEVRDHEPRAALVAADPPYGIYERLAAQSAAILGPGGWLVVEVGQGMAEGVAERFRAAGLEVSGITRDLAGIPRAVTARRH